MASVSLQQSCLRTCRVNMIFKRDMAKLAVFFCGVCFFAKCVGKPVRKRAISEMQLMHSIGKHRHATERQEWLERKLQDVHPASARAPEGIQTEALDSRSQRPKRKEEKWREIKTRRLFPDQMHALQKKVLDKVFIGIPLKRNSH
uniref:Parathyroid hormone n=1 Tax=Geotrypetes seraphini TaxID=260995 RepID=A0A6P8PRY1_GEOSA|nr:parathyroid hormone [Geotrypetes seraphini]